MIPKYKIRRGGPLIYDAHDGTEFTVRAGEGWNVDFGTDIDAVKNEDPRIVTRGILAAMLIHIAKDAGIKLELGFEGETIDKEIPLDVERDVADLITRIKK